VGAQWRELGAVIVGLFQYYAPHFLVFMIKILQLKHKIYKYKPSISVAYRGVAAGGTIMLQRVGFWQIFS